MVGDVVSNELRFEQDAVSSSVPGDERRYPYGNDLFVYNVPQGALFPIPDKISAGKYLRERKPSDGSGCPIGTEEYGTKVF